MEIVTRIFCALSGNEAWFPRWIIGYCHNEVSLPLRYKKFACIVSMANDCKLQNGFEDSSIMSSAGQ
jgi:hypothetical protein